MPRTNQPAQRELTTAPSSLFSSPHADPSQPPPLTRTEWSALRLDIGRPRRLSESFLRAEREKLERYRSDVRRVQAGKVRSAESKSATGDRSIQLMDTHPSVSCLLSFRLRV